MLCKSICLVTTSRHTCTCKSTTLRVINLVSVPNLALICYVWDINLLWPEVRGWNDFVYMRKTLCKFSLMCQWAYLFECSKVHTICYDHTLHSCTCGAFTLQGKTLGLSHYSMFCWKLKAPQIYSTGIWNAARMPSLSFLEWFRNAPILETFSKNRSDRRLLSEEQWGIPRPFQNVVILKWSWNGGD